mgnify:CR=1 FL=1
MPTRAILFDLDETLLDETVAYGLAVQGTTRAIGRITGIDTGAAETHPGVLKVITHRNAPRLVYRDNPVSANPRGRRLRVFTRVSDLPGGLAGLLATVADAGANLIDVEHVREGVDLIGFKASRASRLHTSEAGSFVFIVRAFTSFLSEYSFQKVGLSTVRDLRNQLYERIIGQSHRFFSERPTGEMVSRVVSDADAIQAAVSTRMGDLLQESVTLVGLMLLPPWSEDPETARRLAEAGRLLLPARDRARPSPQRGGS